MGWVAQEDGRTDEGRQIVRILNSPHYRVNVIKSGQLQSKSFVSNIWHYATTTTQIKLMSFTHCSLYASSILQARHQHAQRWNSHHTIRYGFGRICWRISGQIRFRSDFENLRKRMQCVCVCALQRLQKRARTHTATHPRLVYLPAL